MATPTYTFRLSQHGLDLDTGGHHAQTWPSACRAATTVSITISTALNNGDVLDGVTLATGDRVLVKNQSTASQNGIYIVGASPARADDYSASREIVGSVVIVSEGTAGGDTAWLCTTNGPITVGSTSLAYTAFGTGGGSTPALAAVLAVGNDTTGIPIINDDPSYTLPSSVSVSADTHVDGHSAGAGDDGGEAALRGGGGDNGNQSGAEIYTYGGVAGSHGGDMDIFAGNAFADNGRGGDINIGAGAGNGTGRAGQLIVFLPTADPAVADAVYNDRGILTRSAPVGTAARKLASIIAQAAIANTETVVASYSMPANSMAAGTTFRIKAFGRITSGATAGSSIFRCRIGTTTLTGNIPATLTIANAALVTNAPFVLDILVTVRTAGAGGTAIGNVSVEGGITGAFTAVGDVSAISATVVVDTTATKLVEFTYISGNAGTTGRFENVTLELL